MPPKTRPAPAPKAPPAPRTYLARIHPRRPRSGYFAENFVLSGSGYPTFRAAQGWYEVDEATARRLKKALNNPNDPHSRPVFQICTREEAAALEEAEKFKAAEAHDPVPMPKELRRNVAVPRGKPTPDRVHDLGADRRRAREEEELEVRKAREEEEPPSAAERSAARQDRAERGEVFETADDDELAELDRLTEGLGEDELAEELEEEAPEAEEPEDSPEETAEPEEAPASPDLTSSEVRSASTRPRTPARPKAPAKPKAAAKRPATPAGKKR